MQIEGITEMAGRTSSPGLIVGLFGALRNVAGLTGGAKCSINAFSYLVSGLLFFTY